MRNSTEVKPRTVKRYFEYQASKTVRGFMFTQVIPHARPKEFYAKLKHHKTSQVKWVGKSVPSDKALAAISDYCRYDLNLERNWEIVEYGEVGLLTSEQRGLLNV